MPPLPPKKSAKGGADPLNIPPGDAEASDALLPAKQLQSFITPKP